MRVACLINTYPKISHTFIRREIQALERLGFQVMRIALRGWDDELPDVEDRLERERTRYVMRVSTLALLLGVTRMLLMRPIRLLQALALAWRMSRCAERALPVQLAYVAEACLVEAWLQAAGIEHVHAHFGTNSATVAMLTHVLGGPEWSFTVHGPEEFDKWQLIGLTEKVRNCAFVVAICSFGRSQLYRITEHEQWPKIKVVHCGLDPIFRALSTAQTSTLRRLVCVGRLCAQKGQMLLVEAAARLVAQGACFELVLAGDGEMRADIEVLIARFNLHTTVRITGWIDSERVRDEILTARALVLPTFAEGLPVVVMEAMALRRPVVTTYVAGIPELVIPGAHGWLVPAGDVEALVSALHACLDAPVEMLSRMGEAARERVLARHDVDKEAAKLAALFRRIQRYETSIS